VVGFSQAVQDMMFEYGGVIIVDGATNDIRIIGTATLIFICSICGLGAKYETKVTILLNLLELHLKQFNIKILTDEGCHVYCYVDFVK
jgi:solute carrier family 12 sodium/potassium/chloride transporter 2